MIGNLLPFRSILLPIGLEVLVVVYSSHKLYWLHILPNEAIDLLRIRFRRLNGFLPAIGLFLIVSDLWFSPLAISVAPILHRKGAAEITERLRDTTSSLACPTCANPELLEVTIEFHSAEEVV